MKSSVLQNCLEIDTQGDTCFGFTSLCDSVSVYIRPSPRNKREMTDERKKSKQTPPASTTNTVGSYPTIVQISRTPWHWKFTQHYRFS